MPNHSRGIYAPDIYASAGGDRWRFSLGYGGQPQLIVVALNPSTASQTKSDPTVTKVARVSALHGFQGFVLLNLYPVRATDWRSLPEQPDPAALAENWRAIAGTIATSIEPAVWAAWGKAITQRQFFLDSALVIAKQLAEFQPQWLHFGPLSSHGHPRHPSRLSYSWQFRPLAIDSYLQKLTDQCC